MLSWPFRVCAIVAFGFALGFSIQPAFSAQNATTDDGKYVLLHDDGTWEYINKNNDNKNMDIINTTISDLQIDQDENMGKSVRFPGSIYCSGIDYCVMSETLESTLQIQIVIDDLPRATKKVLLTNCNTFEYDCRVVVEGLLDSYYDELYILATALYEQ
jgi:hypothetical protein